MRDTAERRIKMLERLCERRSVKANELATEFGVSIRTVYYDLNVLSCSYPITFKRGTNGGVYIADGFYLGMKYLSRAQVLLLERLSSSLSGVDLVLMLQILKTFQRPT